MPGWIRPAKRTPGMCRDEQNMPWKSQIALALGVLVVGWVGVGWGYVRFGVVLVQEAAAVVLVEDACEAPGLVVEGF
jgi:hypothetical protein